MSADIGAVMSVTRDPARPGWVRIVAQTTKRTRLLWLADDEAAQLLELLRRELPPVEIRFAEQPEPKS